jgi:hypothetical protein
VKCADGSAYCCDHVICTVSLGVLKSKSNQLFTPPLEEEKQSAIKVRCSFITILLSGTLGLISIIHNLRLNCSILESAASISCISISQKSGGLNR